MLLKVNKFYKKVKTHIKKEEEGEVGRHGKVCRKTYLIVVHHKKNEIIVIRDICYFNDWKTRHASQVAPPYIWCTKMEYKLPITY